MQESKPLADWKVVSMTHRYRKPGEWIGTLNDGSYAYIVATARKLFATKGANAAVALRAVKAGDCIKFNHNAFDSEVSTAQMLEASGLNLKCEIKEHIAGEII